LLLLLLLPSLLLLLPILLLLPSLLPALLLLLFLLQVNEQLAADAQALQSAPSPLLLAQQQKTECLADKAKFEAAIENCQVQLLVWHRVSNVCSSPQYGSLEAH
jgi:hypothetical protein